MAALTDVAHATSMTMQSLTTSLATSEERPPATSAPDGAASALRVNWAVIVVIAAAAASVLALQAFLHGHFSALDEYDDGVYFGASIELFHGLLPYRDFAFIQPPMITVWMLPFAAVSSVTGTAAAMEAARFFVDIVSVTNVVLVGVLVRRRTTLQVIVATGLMAFSQGTIRSSQTILLEPFLVLACLIALLCLVDGEGITSSARRLWWCGAFFGIAGATKVWAILPFAAVVIVLSRRGHRSRRKVIGGAIVGFVACSFPFIIGAPASFFQQVVLTQAVRNAGGLPFPQRLADLTGIPMLSTSIAKGSPFGSLVLSLVLIALGTAAAVSWRRRREAPWLPLARVAGWSTLLVGCALLISPTYYYHYSGFMAPFSALLVSSMMGRLSPRFRHVGALLPSTRKAVTSGAVVSALTLLPALVIHEVVSLPVAPHIGDTLSDAIPGHGCILYSDPALALLDNRFTADISGCPSVIDWLGQERVLDEGRSVTVSDTSNRHLQEVMNHWIKSSDAVVLQHGNLGLDSANVSYLQHHFDQEERLPRGLRIYIRDSARA